MQSLAFDNPIERYIDAKKKGLSVRRRAKIRNTLVKAKREFFGKPLSTITKEELEIFIDDLANDGLTESFEDSTKVTYRKILKPFFTWLHPEDKEFASWIRTGNYQPTVGPDDILTADERSRVPEACLTPRDKTMFQTLYESAARPCEFLSLRKSDVSFEADSASLHIRKGKTGFPRDIVIVQDAFPLLKNWIFNEHPLREQSDFPLWVDMSRNSTHEGLQKLGLRRFMTRITGRKGAKIDKRIVPYTLRHTRLTDLAKEGANEALLSQIAGWKAGSQMPAIYIHLSKRDQKPALQKLFGLTP
jgi:integrase/recombinase XerD